MEKKELLDENKSRQSLTTLARSYEEMDLPADLIDELEYL